MYHESWFVWAIVCVIAVILILLVMRQRARRERVPDYYGDEPASYVGEEAADEEFVTEIRSLNAERRRRDYDTRTLAEMAHGAVATLDDNDVITGTLTKIVPDDAETAPGRGSMTSPYNVISEPETFAHEPETSSRVSSLLALVEEFDAEWHLIDGKWHAPQWILDRRDLHEGNWLHDLLVAA